MSFRAPVGLRRALAIVAISAAAIWTGRAEATPSFPAALQARLGMATAPPCTLCHDGQTRRGTVTTPFGKSMLSRGLAAYDEASLRTALDALEAERKDSDSDGTPDIVELRGAADPNLAAGEDVIVPEYGCAVVAVAASLRLGSLESTAVALAALGVAIVRRSRRPRSRKS